MRILKNLEKYTALAAVFFLPSQLALHFWPKSSFIFGIRVDYLAPAIYFTDILIVGLFAFWVINDRKTLLKFLTKQKSVLLFFLAFALLNIIFSSLPFISLYKWFKILEFAFFGVYFYFRKNFLGERIVLKTLLSSSVLISLIGIVQFFLKSTTGFFYYLGERSFNLRTPGIALVSLDGQSFMRAYSVFSHPNSLAGFLGVLILIFLFSRVLKRKATWYLSILILLFAFILTFSLSAEIALGIVTAVFIFNKQKIIKPEILKTFLLVSIIASLLLPLYSEKIIKSVALPENIEQRMELSYVSGKMAGNNFLMGSGLGTFVVNSVEYKGINAYSWLLQPVHNVFLLLLTEQGIIGLLVAVLLFYRVISVSVRNQNFVLLAVCFFVLFTGLSDHYWITLQQNLLLLAFVFGFTLRLKS